MRLVILIVMVWVSLIAQTVFNMVTLDFDQFVASINEPFELKVWHWLMLMLYFSTERGK